ncbi:MAG TPA: hypothetical protein VIV40_33235 [Kofleriaceae bacterium]
MAVSGCFYTDPINQRPSLDIHQMSTAAVYRGGSVPLEAVANDPEGHFVTFKWRAYACTDETSCDPAPYFEKSDARVTIPVPMARAGTTDPVRALHVWLEGKDDYGATARPAQQLWITVDDFAPTIELRAASNYGFVVNMPLAVYAKIGDADDGPNAPQVTWKVYPTQDLVDVSVQQDPNDPAHVQSGKGFTPTTVGVYTVEVTATDSIAPFPTVETVDITVDNDKPPCLSQLSPIVAIAPAAWPMSEPTLFQVHVVTDDLDPYPTANDVLLGTTSFTWSLLAPGGTRQVLSGVSGNSVALDPASFHPGDIVELRVEIADRNNTPLTCADANATCSLLNNSCIQRQTWRVEVR